MPFDLQIKEGYTASAVDLAVAEEVARDLVALVLQRTGIRFPTERIYMIVSSDYYAMCYHWSAAGATAVEAIENLIDVTTEAMNRPKSPSDPTPPCTPCTRLSMCWMTTTNRLFPMTEHS